MSVLSEKLSNVRRSSFARSLFAYSLNPAVGLITGPIVASSLGASGRGQLAAILQPLTLADSVAAAGVPTAVTFFIARGYLRRETSRLGYQTVAVISVLVYLALLGYASELVPAQDLSGTLVAVAWLSVIVAAFANVRRAKHAAIRNWRVLDAERTVSAVLRLLSISGLAIAGIDSLGPFVAAYLLSGMVAFVLLVVPVPGRQYDGGKPIERAAFLRFSSTAAITTVAVAAGNRLDQAILPVAVSSSELGVYAVAVTVAEIPLVVATVGSRNMLSDSALNRGSFSPLALALKVGLLTLLAAIALALIARPLVPFFFGEDFVASIPVVDILLVGSVIGSVTSVITAFITGDGLPGRASIVHIANVVVVAVLYMCFWSSMSPTKAAVFAVSAQLVACVLAIALASSLKTMRSRGL